MKTTQAQLTTGKRELPLPLRMVSDWHLGHPGSQIEKISQVSHLLHGVGTLVMVGDGREELVESWREKADSLWDELQRACEERGVVFVALTGNHDPGASPEGWMALDEGRVLVTHGDMVYETSSPWSRELFERRDEVQEVLSTRDCSNLEERWHCAREIGCLLRPNAKMSPNFLAYLKLALWPPERLVEVGKVWAGFAKEGDRFLNQFAPEVETLVCGHFHRGGQFQVGKRNVLNTGSLMKMCRGFAADYDGEKLSLLRVMAKRS